MSAWRWLSVPLLLGQVGCTVAAVSGKEDARPKNSCSSQSSCGKGESCIGGLCQALNGELEAVLLTATPALESSLPNLTLVTHVGSVGGAKDVLWPGPARVTGRLVLPDGHCYPEFIDDPTNAILPSKDGSLPVAATLSLRERFLGLPQQTYYSKTVTAPVTGYTFEAQVPSGEYDVYLVPPKRQKGPCVVPPQLFRRVPVGATGDSTPNGMYRFNLAAISSMELHILWPESSPSLVGWTADILEMVGGNPISTEVVLGEPELTRGKLDYEVLLAYSAVTEAEPSQATAKVAADLLRLRPPADVVAPTIFLARSVLGLLQDQADPVNLTVFNRFPQPVTVRGQMATQEEGRPIAGTLTLFSQEIYGVDAGVFASFQTTVTVDESGVWEVHLPPGKYLVQAVPPVVSGSGTEALSVLQAEWDIPANIPVQFGKLLELSRTSQITGQSQAPGADVRAEPVLRFLSPYDEAFGVRPFTPRSTGAVIDESGRFVLQLDELKQTRVNITVQAAEELGFGWFVRPGLEVGVGNQDLGRVSLPVPSVLSGQASISQNGATVPLRSATIRAYAYLDASFQSAKNLSQAESLVQVAETRSDGEGAFRLLLPATLDGPK